MVALLLVFFGGTWRYLRAADETRGIPVGIFRIKPKLSVASKYDDNLYKHETNRVGEKTLTITPVVQFSTHWKKTAFEVNYRTSLVRHEKRESEDTADHNMGAKLTLNPTRQIEITAGADYAFNHDKRGAPDTTTTGFDTPPDDWQETGLNAGIQLTHNRLRTLLDWDYGFKEKQDLGHYWHQVGLKLMFALAPRTSLLTQTSVKDIIYENTSVGRNSRENTIQAGLEWSGAAKTTGAFAMGYTQKAYQAGGGQDDGAMTMTGNVGWSPTTRSKLNLTTKREFNEGGATAANYVTTDVALGLNHQLRSFLTLNSNLSYTLNDYSSNLENDVYKGSLGFDYRFPRWFTLSGTYNRTNQNSNTVGSSYDANDVMVTISGGL